MKTKIIGLITALLFLFSLSTVMAYQANTSSYTIDSISTGVAGSSANTSSYTFDAGTSSSAGAVNGSTGTYSFTGGTTVMYCGDGVCNNDENISTCAVDCNITVGAAEEESILSIITDAINGGSRSGGRVEDDEEEEEEELPPRKRKTIKEIIEEDIEPVIDRVKRRTAELIYGPEASTFSWSYFIVVMIVVVSLIVTAWLTKKKVKPKSKPHKGVKVKKKTTKRKVKRKKK